MTVTKFIYIVLIVIYVLLIIAWFNRYSISYRIFKTNPNLIEERSLTNQEYYGLEKAAKFSHQFSQIFIYSSLFMVAISFVFLKMEWFSPVIIVKIVLGIAGLFAFVLILANGISFIPGPPIR